MKFPQLPEPIIFTKDIRKGIRIVLQFIVEASLIVGVFIAGLISVVNTIGFSWIGLYIILFIMACICAIANSVYY
jgi:hypothetical protein